MLAHVALQHGFDLSTVALTCDGAEVDNGLTVSPKVGFWQQKAAGIAVACQEQASSTSKNKASEASECPIGT
eukprot:2396946-Amphidinium_carterae.3